MSNPCVTRDAAIDHTCAHAVRKSHARVAPRRQMPERTKRTRDAQRLLSPCRELLYRSGIQHQYSLSLSLDEIYCAERVMMLIVAAKRACLRCVKAINVDDEALECTGCKRVVYCSSDCKEQDTLHDGLCRELQKLNVKEKKATPASGRRSYDQYISDVSALANPAATSLKAYFGFDYEGHTPFTEFVTNGIKCEGCYLTPFQKPVNTQFTPCPRCEVAWWCSPACKDNFAQVHTSAQCGALYDTFCAERMELDYMRIRGSTRSLNIVTDKGYHKKYVPISSISSWNEYFRTFDPRIAETTIKLAKELGAQNKNARNAVVLLTKQANVIPLTIATALEHAYPDMPKRKSICVHLVGADMFERLNMAMFENVLHYFPRLRTLKVCFVGPGPAVDNQYDSKNKACEACKAEGRAREMVFYRSNYHDCPWSKAGNSYAPDLVVGFNTGMSEMAVSAWKQTLDLILDLGVPAVFTAYSKGEVANEEKMLRGRGVRFIKDVEKNKWRGVIGRANLVYESAHLEGGQHTTVYNSNYTYMVRGREA